MLEEQHASAWENQSKFDDSGESSTPSAPSLPLRRTRHNSSSLHLRDILLQCEHCSRPPPSLSLSFRLRSRRWIIYSERAKEELWLRGRASGRATKTQNSKAATQDAWHDMQSGQRSLPSSLFLARTLSLSLSSLPILKILCTFSASKERMPCHSLPPKKE